jgi:hypothetical protein
MWLTLGFAALGVQPPPPGLQQVTMGWTASSDPTVTGYYLYYGTATGVYTNKVNVGTNTTFTVAGLVLGTTYYFASTSYNGAASESVYSSEIAYIVPGILTVTQSPASAVTRIQFPVAATHAYQLQASSNLQSWSNVWLTPTEATNQWIEYDEPRTNTVSARFYRLILY